MSVVTDIRKTVTEVTPVMAVVGATDLAVEQVRRAVAEANARSSAISQEIEGRVTRVQMDIEKAVASLDPDYLQKFLAKNLGPKAIQSGAQQAPALAVSRALEVAGRVETGYESLAERGKQLVTRVENQRATKDLVRQGRATVSRGKAAVTTAQKGVDRTVADAKATLTIGRREAAETVGAVEEAVTAGTKGTRAGIKRTATTARKRTAATKSTAKGARTSATRTARKAAGATGAGVEKVGD